MLKNKFITILMVLALVCPIGFQSSCIYAEPPEGTETTEIVEDIQQSNIDEETAVTTDTAQINDNIANNDTFKQPISKKKIAKKFLLAMFGVAVSSFLIFFVLTLYNKVRCRVTNRVKTPEGETTLKTPDNINEGIQIFLKKTQWK